jgi:polyhydroxybutyrate depolymerase
MSDTIAAVAPVAGVLVYSPCQPSQPVSVIDFHGLSDTSVPYDGGMNNMGQSFPPVEESLSTWAGLDGCSGTPQVEQDGILTHTIYSGCQNNTAVELYTIQGIGHSWPTKYVVPATQMIWDFFAAHPKQ